MKRVVSILILAMFLNGCDDGDLIQEDIILKMQPHKMLANNIIYKLKDSEALILDATGIIFP
jgi:PBP1b-binding outer membrane lipoprotein LpoB